MKYIGVDMGSTFTKAVLFDVEQGKVVEHQSVPSPARNQTVNPFHYVVPAKTLVETVHSMIDAYIEKYDDVEGVVFSTQMHGFVYACGGEDMYISWQDMRCHDLIPDGTKTYLEYLETIISHEEMADHGVWLKPSLGMCNLYTMLAQDETISRNGELFTLGSYVIRDLTGNNVCHISNAAPLGLVDVKRHKWDIGIIHKLGFDEIILPKLADNDYELCGYYRHGTKTIKVFPDYGDTQISCLGSNIYEEAALVNLGTAAQVMRNNHAFVPGEYEIRPFFNGTYLYTISNMPGGRNLDVLINFVRSIVERFTGTSINTNDIWKMIEPADDSRGLIVNTGFYKNPFYTNGGAITGINQTNLSINGIFGAAYRDMAETFWKYIHCLGGNADTIKQIICAGGVAWKNPKLVDCIAEITQKDTRLSPIHEESLNGLFLISQICSGIRKSFDFKNSIQV